MDVLSRLKLLKALTALTPPAVFPVRSFTAKEICVHEPVQGLNLNRRSISGLEPDIGPKESVFSRSVFSFVQLTTPLCMK